MKFSDIKYFIPYGLVLHLQKARQLPQSTAPDLFLAEVSQNKIFKDRHIGKRCFILATGPSINSQNLEFLAGEICFALSEFYLHEKIEIIRPNYYVLAPNHHPFGKDKILHRFEGLLKKHVDENIYFLGDNEYQYSYWNILRNHSEYAHMNLKFINYFSSYQLNEENVVSRNTWDIAGRPFALRTVVYSAIQIAVYMGFKEIYLLGCDHDYLKDITRIENHHFYAESLGTSDVELLRGFTLERWFEEYHLRWKQYRLMKEHLNARGINIYNATNGGMLDVFPRVKYENLFG